MGTFVCVCVSLSLSLSLSRECQWADMSIVPINGRCGHLVPLHLAIGEQLDSLFEPGSFL